MGAAHLHAHRGLFPAREEEPWLWEDGDAKGLLVPAAKPALHSCVAVPGPQRPVVVGGCCEVPGLGLGSGGGCVQGCVHLMCRRVTELRLLGHCAKRLHGGEPQLGVAVTAGNNELGLARARQRVLQDGVPGCSPVRLVQWHVAVAGGGLGNPEGVLGVLPAHA